MLKKTIVSIAIGVAIGLSPLRSSALANFLIAITGGWHVKFNYSRYSRFLGVPTIIPTVNPSLNVTNTSTFELKGSFKSLNWFWSIWIEKSLFFFHRTLILIYFLFLGNTFFAWPIT